MKDNRYGVCKHHPFGWGKDNSAARQCENERLADTVYHQQKNRTADTTNRRLIFQAAKLNGWGKEVNLSEVKKVRNCTVWFTLIMPFPVPIGICILYGRKKASFGVKKRNERLAGIAPFVSEPAQ